MRDDVTQQVQNELFSSPKIFGANINLFSEIMGMSKIAFAVFDDALNLEYLSKNAQDVLGISIADFNGDYSYENIAKTLIFREQSQNVTSSSIHDFIHKTFKHKDTHKINLSDGRWLSLKRKAIDGKFIISAQDITKAQMHKNTLSLALKSGCAGYGKYIFKTRKMVFSSKYLESKLSESQIHLMKTEGVFAVAHPEDIESTMNIWKNALKHGRPFKAEIRLLTGHGDYIWTRWHAEPQFSDTGTLVSYNAFFKDVTQEVDVRKDLEKAKDIAEKSLKAKNDFLAKLAHEVRTPMNGVIGIADALIHHHADETINPKLELIQGSAEKILRIVDETLDHAKLNAEKLTLDPKPASPTKSVEDVINLWQPKALQNKVDLSLSIGPDVPQEITFDKFRYEQCINNLISNAVKFAPNGKIKVVLTTAKNESGNKRIIVAVQDNGIGMTPEQQRNIFEAYTQGDKTISSRFGGTGLGMTITKDIIELMGGTISVRSQLEKGTVFVLSMPYKEETSEAFEEEYDSLVEQILEEAKPEETKYSKLRVLVADDNSTNHMVVMSLIESIVGEVHLASDGQEAIDVLKTKDIDIVLMDIHMPVMDGIEATLSIRSSQEDWADVLIIALTADPQYQQKRLCKNIGMDDALAKPVKLSDILGAFDNVLGLNSEVDVAA